MYITVTDYDIYRDAYHFFKKLESSSLYNGTSFYEWIDWIDDDTNIKRSMKNHKGSPDELLKNVIEYYTDIDEFGSEVDLIHAFLCDTWHDSTIDFIVLHDGMDIRISKVDINFTGEPDLANFFIKKLKQGNYNREYIMVRLTEALLKEE